MLSPQASNTTSPVEHVPTLPTAMEPQQAVPMYDAQYIEAMAQRLMPRLMPEILYQLRNSEFAGARNRGFGMSLALAITSMALFIPLVALMLNAVTIFGGGITAALVGFAMIGLVMILINVAFNYMLFRTRG